MVTLQGSPWKKYSAERQTHLVSWTSSGSSRAPLVAVEITIIEAGSGATPVVTVESAATTSWWATSVVVSGAAIVTRRPGRWAPPSRSIACWRPAETALISSLNSKK